MSAVFFMSALAGLFALLFLAAITLCGRMNDRRAVDRDEASSETGIESQQDGK